MATEAHTESAQQCQQKNTNDDKEEDLREEWEIRRDDLKSSADGHFRAKSYPEAIAAYEAALQFDPTNHILLSNKSAAHLANGEKSKALADARKCVKHASKWAKGHTRLAAAVASLGRFGEAASIYTKVLSELEPENEVARRGLDDCRRKERHVKEEKEREMRRVQMELDKQKAENEEKQKKDVNKYEDKSQNQEVKINNTAAGNEEDDLLDNFFSEVEKAVEKPKLSNSINLDCKSSNNEHDATRKESQEIGGDDSSKRIKVQLSNLGTSASQINRLLQPNYEWKNLNPFYVLDIPHSIDDESIISARYRALSLLVHPDKCPEDPLRAKEAFDQVKKAMSMLKDLDKRKHVQALVEQGMKQGKRDWEAQCTSGKRSYSQIEYDRCLYQAQTKATMKIFAEIEQKRREVDRRKRKFEQRERAQEDEEKEKEKNEREHDKRWRDVERVEKRIGNWRDFQGGSLASNGTGREKGGKKAGKKSRWG